MKKFNWAVLSLSLLLIHPIYTKQQTSSTAAPYHIVEDQANLPILNPDLADRKVEKLVLDNGMQVYLVSDPGVKQSAACVAVEAGSWQDPQKYPGLAHFLEHMLFMGTAAYPKEFEYMQFIGDHGGSVNAYTASDRTVYLFSINNDNYADALDRFSHFFIDPLFAPNSIDRELHAVDQEHSKNIENDGWRQYMILKETANPNHPMASFSTGNAQTLSGIPQDVLKKWYQTHYSANRMHLIMVSPLPLDKMRELAVQDFSAVPSFTVKNRPLPSEMTSNLQRGHMIFIKPVKDLKQLSLVWEVPANFALDADRKAPDLVAYALEQDGPHSLIAELKKEKLAEDIHISSDRFGKETILFSIDISLTDYGLTQIDSAVTKVFQAIALLKEESFPPYLFNEIQTMAKLNYQYQSRDDAFQTVMDLSNDVVYENLDTYPLKTRVPTHFDAAFIRNFVDTLKAENCCYLVSADPAKTGVLPDTKEKWMGAEYAIKDIGQKRLTAWDDVKPSPLIQLPGQNPYIPSNLALVSFGKNAPDSNNPLLLQSDEGSKIYFAQDNLYHVPEVCTLFTFKSPLLDMSAKSKVLSDLYAFALKETLSADLSFASNAGIQVGIAPDDLSMKISLQGYNDKSPLLLRTIFERFKKVAPTSEQFEIYRSSLASDYDNASKELPVRQATEILNGLIFNSPTNADKLNAIKQISYDDFVQFSKTLFSTSYVEGLIYGNMETNTARTMWQELKSSLAAKPYPLSMQKKKQFLVLSEKDGPYMIAQKTDRQGNGVLLLIEEGDFSFENRAAQQILGSALKDGFFETLRTKQQTAYIAQARDVEQEKQLLQYFAVQSSTHYPPELLARFELFIEDFNKNITQNITQERFKSIGANIATLLKTPPENMAMMATQLNKFAFEYKDFRWIDKRIQSIETLSYDTFCAKAHQFLSRDNSRRLAVLVEGVLPKENDFHYELITKENIGSFGSFVTVK